MCSHVFSIILISLLLTHIQFNVTVPFLKEIPLYLSNVFTIILTPIILILIFLKKLKMNDFEKKYLFIAVIFIIYMILSYVYRLYVHGHRYDYFLIMQLLSMSVSVFFLMSILINNLIISKNDLKFIFFAFLIIVNSLQLKFYLNFKEVRASKLLDSVNVYSCIMILFVPFLMYHIFSKNKIFKVISLLILLLIIYISFGTGSRSYTLFLIFGIILSIFVLKRKYFFKAFVFFGIIFGILVGSVTLISKSNPHLIHPFIQRSFSLDLLLNKVSSPGTSESDRMRLDLYKLGVEEFFKDPLVGSGKLFLEVKMYDAPILQPAHNIILEWLVMVGLIGFGIYFYLLFHQIIIFKNNFKKPEYQLVCLTSLLFIIYSLFQSTSTFAVILNVVVLLNIYYSFDFIFMKKSINY